MKSKCLIIAVVVGIGLIISLLLTTQTTYALGNRHLEMVFVLTDAETGTPIPNASIDLMAEEYKGTVLDQQVITLTTDSDGRARFVREKNSCEDVIRTFRKTVTLIDLTWAPVSVSANGYSPIEHMRLQDAKYDNKGYSSERHLQQVEFNVPLHKRPGN